MAGGRICVEFNVCYVSIPIIELELHPLFVCFFCFVCPYGLSFNKIQINERVMINKIT